MPREPNAQYNLAEPGSLPIKLAAYQRRRMYRRFVEVFKLGSHGTRILDVGVTSDQSYASSNYLEAWYPWKGDIVACGIDDATFLEIVHPGIKFVKANGLSLPFRDRSFDIVHASAVLEHVGTIENQTQLIRECCRVAKHGIFLTTPNRWFPVEFHTVLPLLHWLPKRVFRCLMRYMGRGFFADENNLNLMTARELQSVAQALSIEGRRLSFSIEKLPLAGWPANLLFIGVASTPDSTTVCGMSVAT